MSDQSSAGAPARQPSALPHETPLAGAFPPPQPVSQTAGTPNPAKMSDEEWLASLPSFGDPMNIGGSSQPVAPRAPVAAPMPATPVAPVAVPTQQQPAPVQQQPVPAQPSASAPAYSAPAAPMQAASAAAPFVAPQPSNPVTAPLPGSTLGTGYGLGPASLSGGMTLPAIDPDSDAAGLTQHGLTRTTAGFPIVAAPGASLGQPPRRQTAYQNWTPPPSHSRTGAVWALVFLPIIVAVVFVALMVLVLLPQIGLSLAQVQSDPVILLNQLMLLVGISAVLNVLHLIVTIWLGFKDRVSLERLGFVDTASPWWNLLSPFIYLIVRSVRVRRITKTGSLPLTVYILLYIAPGVALGVAAGVAKVMESAALIS